jgi:hypothetical protein
LRIDARGRARGNSVTEVLYNHVASTHVDSTFRCLAFQIHTYYNTFGRRSFILLFTGSIIPQQTNLYGEYSTRRALRGVGPRGPGGGGVYPYMQLRTFFGFVPDPISIDSIIEI